jgi:hypothetical protein
MAERIWALSDFMVMEQRMHFSTPQVLNETYSEGLRAALSRPHSPVDDAAFISIDRLGADVRVRRGTDYIVERLTFATVRARRKTPTTIPETCQVFTLPSMMARVRLHEPWLLDGCATHSLSRNPLHTRSLHAQA